MSWIHHVLPASRAGCGVCIGGGRDYDGSPEFYSMKDVVARKEHVCGECGRAIPKGAMYERVSGKFDGDLFSEKTCMDCAHIRDGLSCDEGVPHGILWQEIRNIFPHFTTGCLNKVESASAKAYLLQRWREWKGLAA
jgi:hypothetical protein